MGDGAGPDPGPTAADWLDGFADIEAYFARRSKRFTSWEEDGQPDPTVLDWAALAECLAAASDDSESPRRSASRASGFAAKCVLRRSAETVDHDFLNSFIADDLARVADAAARGKVGSALCDYLRPNAETSRPAIGSTCGPARRGPIRNGSRARPARPLAREPRSPTRTRSAARRQRGSGDGRRSGPALRGQRAAWNGEDNHVPRSGRGAGDRASGAPSGVADPPDAFLEEPERWKTTRYQRTVHRLRPELTGFELVVASSNNGAVENVTLEMPIRQGRRRSLARVCAGHRLLPDTRRAGDGCRRQDKRGGRGVLKLRAWAWSPPVSATA